MVHGFTSIPNVNVIVPVTKMLHKLEKWLKANLARDVLISCMPNHYGLDCILTDEFGNEHIGLGISLEKAIEDAFDQIRLKNENV